MIMHELDEFIYKLSKLQIDYFIKYNEEPTHVFISNHMYRRLKQFHATGKGYCELSNNTSDEILGMKVVLIVNSEDNQIFLNGNSNMFLFK